MILYTLELVTSSVSMDILEKIEVIKLYNDIKRTLTLKDVSSFNIKHL